MTEKLNGLDLKNALEKARSCLEQHIEELNSLNVFPVPDGDTGINMFSTLKAATGAVAGSESTSVAVMSASAARGALLGARGNSGVILSQILQGIARGMEAKEHFSSSDFARALHSASEAAYKVVVNPVEGTILTVIREASGAASRAAEKGASFGQTIAAVVSQARNTVNKTPEMLPQLEEAGVVDAGAKGLFYFFQGMKESASHKLTRDQVAEVPSRASISVPAEGYGFDLQFMIEGDGLSLKEIRRRIESMGESVIVVGDEHLVRVHIHTPNTDSVLNYATGLGHLKDIVIEDMDMQVEKRQVRNKQGGGRHG
jgi:hypothetical protein